MKNLNEYLQDHGYPRFLDCRGIPLFEREFDPFDVDPSDVLREAKKTIKYIRKNMLYRLAKLGEIINEETCEIDNPRDSDAPVMEVNDDDDDELIKVVGAYHLWIQEELLGVKNGGRS